MAQQPCDQKYESLDKLWLTTALTHVCGFAPYRDDLRRTLSTRLDAHSDVALDVSDVDVSPEFVHGLIRNVCRGDVSLDEAEGRFKDELAGVSKGGSQ